MSIVTYSEWLDWRKSPVTKAFYDACLERIDDAKNQLAFSAGLDQAQDNFYRGFVHGYIEMLDFRVEEPPLQEEGEQE